MIGYVYIVDDCCLFSAILWGNKVKRPFDFTGEVRFYILGISDEIEVATIVYDEATILAFKEMISLPFQSSSSFLSFPLSFWFWLR